MKGFGVLQGMAVTAKNFTGSFFDKNRLVTVQYPEQKTYIADRYRNYPFLVFDGNSEEGLRCTACTTCEKACPPSCIKIEMARDAQGKPTKKPKVFDIDISVCMSCGICVEVCPFDAIKMDNEFEIAVEERHDSLLYHKEQLSKPNEYFHKIRPEEAREVDGRLNEAKEKAAAKAKAAAAKKAAEAASTKEATTKE